MALFPTRILLATDGSEDARSAAAAAIEVASATSSELNVVHCLALGDFFESHPYPGMAGEGFSFPTEAMEELEQQARRLLDEEVDEIGESGGTVARAHFRIGALAEEVVALSEEIGAGFVVVGSRGHGGMKRLVLGSVSEGVVRRARCSVLVVRKKNLAAFPSRILMVTDGSEEAGRASEVAAEISRSFGSELHLVHVGFKAPIFRRDLSLHSHSEENAHNTLAEEVMRIEKAGGKLSQIHHPKSQPSAGEIEDLAEELEVGVVVVGSRSLGAKERAPTSSLPERIVRHAPCSVLVVRAEDQYA